MKLILGMVVGLIPGEFVLDGDPASFVALEQQRILVKTRSESV